MSVELTETHLCDVIAAALKTANANDTLSVPVTIESLMGSPREWDSLSFVAVFYAIGEAFEVELDEDDAVHFQTARGIYDFLDDVMNA